MEVITLPVRFSRDYGDVHAVWAPPPGGRELLVLTGRDEGANRLTRWDLTAGKATSRLNVVTDEEHGLCWPPPLFDAAFTVMTLGGFVKRVGKRRRVALGGDRYPEPCAVTPDGSAVFGGVNSVAYGSAWPVYRWELAGAFGRGVERVEPAEALVYPGTNGLVDGAVSPDGTLLAAVPYQANRVFRWRLPGCDPLSPLPVVDAADGGAAVRFSPDGRTLAVSAAAGVRLLDPDGGRAGRNVPAGASAGFAFTPDSRRLVTARGGVAAVWDTATGERVAAYQWRKIAGNLNAVAVLPDGLTAVAGGTRGRLVRWDLPA